MKDLPLYVSLLFGATTACALLMLYKATRYVKVVIVITLLWIAVQSVAAINDFYLTTNTVPPRFLLLIGPPLLLIIFLFSTKQGRQFITSLDTKTLTLLHVIRIPVEIVLLLLYTHKLVPQLMTFEGRNFDILSGLSAPLIYYFGYVQKRLSRSTLLIWNWICIALLLNIVINAILSAPFALQQFAFDQPNIAVLYFPFVLLPACVVPIVFFAHLVCVTQLLTSKKRDTLK